MEKLKLEYNVFKYREYELTHKIIALLFKEFRKYSNGNSKISIVDQKIILDAFQKVIRCLRRECIGIAKLYDNQFDDIEILIELSETLELKRDILDVYEKLNTIMKHEMNSEIKIEIHLNLLGNEYNKEKITDEASVTEVKEVSKVEIKEISTEDTLAIQLRNEIEAVFPNEINIKIER